MKKASDSEAINLSVATQNPPDHWHFCIKQLIDLSSEQLHTVLSFVVHFEGQESKQKHLDVELSLKGSQRLRLR